ncbi:TetR family transcriptional regulator, partial [Streptomyces sp. NPDC006267]
MPERKPRKDAARNRQAVLAAADALFARCESPEGVTLAAVAAAAGVGKGTLFRAFGDRPGLLRALYEARLEPVREAVEAGPPPLGPTTPPRQRVPALLDTLLCFKLDN